MPETAKRFLGLFPLAAFRFAAVGFFTTAFALLASTIKVWRS
jgi:hypothetical protein